MLALISVKYSFRSFEARFLVPLPMKVALNQLTASLTPKVIRPCSVIFGYHREVVKGRFFTSIQLHAFTKQLCRLIKPCTHTIELKFACKNVCSWRKCAKNRTEIEFQNFPGYLSLSRRIKMCTVLLEILCSSFDFFVKAF